VRDRSQWVTIPVPAIVTPELFEAARAAMEANRQTYSGRPPAREYPLKGLVKCGRCGRPCFAIPNRGRALYNCGNRDRQMGAGKKLCPGVSVRVAAVESATLAQVERCAKRPKIILGLVKAAAAAKQTGAVSKERGTLEAEITKLRKREERTEGLLLDAELQESAARFRADLVQTRAKRRAAEQRLAALQQSVDTVVSQSKLERFWKIFGGRWSRTLSVAEQRELLRSVLEAVVLHGDHVELKFRVPAEPDKNCFTEQSRARPHDCPAQRTRDPGGAWRQFRPGSSSRAHRNDHARHCRRRAWTPCAIPGYRPARVQPLEALRTE
jgi:site-specific DNA recombinase